MSTEITFKHRNAEEAKRFDFTRIGLGLAGSDDGMTVVVEPDIDGWDGVRDEVRVDILRAGLAAAGIFPEITVGDAQ